MELEPVDWSEFFTLAVQVGILLLAGLWALSTLVDIVVDAVKSLRERERERDEDKSGK